jgi:hypothetical protein
MTMSKMVAWVFGSIVAVLMQYDPRWQGVHASSFFNPESSE